MNSQTLMFDWVAKSRTVADIQKRCDQLIAEFRKELVPEENQQS
jgi:hypothetical protein